MTNTNVVVLVGNLTRDLSEQDFGYVGQGTARANVSIAVNRSKKQGDQWIDEVNFFDVTIWGKTAENLKPYLRKGQKIAVEGYLKQDRWEKDGQKHSRVSVVAESVELCGGNFNNQQNTQNGFQPVNNQQPQGYNGGMPDNESIPF